MRAGLSTIQQTLTPEAAAVLNQSIAEAARRSHGQATPLHVAATLLSSPTGYLRQACIKSHPNSSHPLQGGRALELCFSVALERLPAAQNVSAGAEPPISNALMAALKRAQAQQRRGCPEQQQQPLLAVKVELEQLIISILDDPSVSRVMREASFSSPAVKATIEQSLLSTSSSGHGNSSTNVNFSIPNVNNSFSSSGMSCTSLLSNSGGIGFGFRPAVAAPVPVPVPVPGAIPTRNLYVNPKLQKISSSGNGIHLGTQRDDEVKKVLDTMSRLRKRNPILVGESEAEQVVKEVVRRLECKEIKDGLWKNVKIFHLEKVIPDKTQLAGTIAGLIESWVGDLGPDSGIILDLGDLKWLVEQPSTFVGPSVGSGVGIVTEAGRSVVGAVGKVLAKGEEGSKVWLIGTASYETYLRCQVHHPSMEHDWDLQSLPVAARNLTPGMFPRYPTSGLSGSPLPSLSALRGLSNLPVGSPKKLSEKLEPIHSTPLCSQCKQNYEKEKLEITAKSSKKSRPDCPDEDHSSLPQWLRKAASHDGLTPPDQTKDENEQMTITELQRKWQEACVRCHPGHHQHPEGIRPALSMPFLSNQSIVHSQLLAPKVHPGRNFGSSLQLSSPSPVNQPPARSDSPPASPVRTDLALGCPKVTDTDPSNDITKDFLGVKDGLSSPKDAPEEFTKSFLGLGPSKELIKALEAPEAKLANSLDVDSVKKILKGLLEAVPWQIEAATAITSVITQCKIGNGKRRFGGSKGDIWLLLTGPDKIGKRKMASVVADLVCGTTLTTIGSSLARDDEKSETRYRGKTASDQIVDVIRKKPSSVIMLQDIDKADVLVRGSIKRAMERGRLADSHGREVSLGNMIFILTANWLPETFKIPAAGTPLDEKKIACLGRGDWQLRLSLCEKTAKRHAGWLLADRPIKHKKDVGSGFSFDLNETADAGDDKADGSLNSSDLTVEREDEHPFINSRLLSHAPSSFSRELLNLVDSTIVFKPVDFDSLRQDISTSISRKFASMIGDSISVEIQDEALERIVCGVWLGWLELEEWSDRALVPIIRRLKLRLPSNTESLVVLLETANDSLDWHQQDAPLRSIEVTACGF